jgi:hypothetical protein
LVPGGYIYSDSLSVNVRWLKKLHRFEFVNVQRDSSNNCWIDDLGHWAMNMSEIKNDLSCN